MSDDGGRGVHFAGKGLHDLGVAQGGSQQRGRGPLRGGGLWCRRGRPGQRGERDVASGLTPSRPVALTAEFGGQAVECAGPDVS